MSNSSAEYSSLKSQAQCSSASSSLCSPLDFESVSGLKTQLGKALAGEGIAQERVSWAGMSRVLKELRLAAAQVPWHWDG